MNDYSDQPGSRAYAKWEMEHDLSTNRILPKWEDLLQAERDEWNAVAFEHGRATIPASWRPFDPRGPLNSQVFGLDDDGKRVLHPLLFPHASPDPVKLFEESALHQAKLPIDISVGDQVFKAGSSLIHLVARAKALHELASAMISRNGDKASIKGISYTASGRVAQPGNPDWCVGCNPDNCPGCGSAPSQ